jgi:hypothetical protein
MGGSGRLCQKYKAAPPPSKHINRMATTIQARVVEDIAILNLQSFRPT